MAENGREWKRMEANGSEWKGRDPEFRIHGGTHAQQARLASVPWIGLGDQIYHPRPRNRHSIDSKQQVVQDPGTYCAGGGRRIVLSSLA